MNDDAKNILSFRIQPETLARVRAVVQRQETGQDSRMTLKVKPTVSLFISDLLEAHAERRLVILAEPLPFTPNVGDDPRCPILLSEG